MAVPLFTGRIIAVIWDFDQTLIPGQQQQPIFNHYGIDAGDFWEEVNNLQDHYAAQGLEISRDAAYLNHILTYVEAGEMPGLSNELLRRLGQELKFFPGLPNFLEAARRHIEGRDVFRNEGIEVEHYIVSTGLRQVMRGSEIATHVKEIWGCEFIENPAPPSYLQEPPTEPEPGGNKIRQIGYVLDNTTKTRAIWEINKGVNVDANIQVNDNIAAEDRRVPLRNMLYIADGPSDIPVFSILNQYGGQTLGVYNPDSEEHFRNVKGLRDQGRVKHIAMADYSEDSETSRWILATLEEIAQLIVRDRRRAQEDRVQRPGGHVQ